MNTEKLSAGDVIALGQRSVRVCGMPDGETLCLDHRGRVAVRNLETNRLSYVPKYRLLRAGYTHGMVKRGYSREFTPNTERRVRFEIDRIPPTLWAKVRAKAKRDGVSLRSLILGLLKKWADEG